MVITSERKTFKKMRSRHVSLDRDTLVHFNRSFIRDRSVSRVSLALRQRAQHERLLPVFHHLILRIIVFDGVSMSNIFGNPCCSNLAVLDCGAIVSLIRLIIVPHVNYRSVRLHHTCTCGYEYHFSKYIY